MILTLIKILLKTFFHIYLTSNNLIMLLHATFKEVRLHISHSTYLNIHHI